MPAYEGIYCINRSTPAAETPRGRLRCAWLADSIAANDEYQRPESGAADRRTGKAADAERPAETIKTTIAKGLYDNGNDSL